MLKLQLRGKFEMDRVKEYSCRGIVKGIGQGEALVSSDAMCFYLCDPTTGEVIEKDHAIEGKSVAGKVLVVKSGKGSSVVMVDGLYQLKVKGTLPAAIIVQDIEPVLVSCAVVVGIPVVDRLEVNPYEIISDGDKVTVDASSGIVKVEKA